MEERMQFLARLRDGERLVDLCREFEISRKTGSKFKKRFDELGLNGLLDQRRAPKTIPHRTPDAIVKMVLALRRTHPTWGPKKLHEALRKKNPSLHIPAPSTIADIHSERSRDELAASAEQERLDAVSRALAPDGS